MAVARTTILAVRVGAPDGTATEYPWDPDAWYIVRDDCPFLDVLVDGYAIRAVDTHVQLPARDEPGPDGASWQRWDLASDLARERRLGEMVLPLKVPKGCWLRCYVIPTRLLGLSDVIQMIDDIEVELGTAVAWERSAHHPERVWSRRKQGDASAPEQLLVLVEEELRAARSIRYQPFVELGPHARRGLPLPENAVVSHWAARRLGQLREAERLIGARVDEAMRLQKHRKAPKRVQRIQEEVDRLTGLTQGVEALRTDVSPLVIQAELSTPLSPGPSYQRDHRLRRLLRAFAAPAVEIISPIEAPRSSYPPVRLNRLWELWGAVWLANRLRALGFEGGATPRGAEGLLSCTWVLRRNEIEIELDYEPDPALVDHAALPAAHERVIPALEWASTQQELDADRPFLGLEERCSPDYLLRISTPQARALVVGDACLATPEFHGTGQAKAKPHTVEHYRRTLGWVVDGSVVRCHPMGGFVVFPPPESSWSAFEQLDDVRDCSLLAPSPGQEVSSHARLENLLSAVLPGVRWRRTLAS
jgi:hypothetical protein